MTPDLPSPSRQNHSDPTNSVIPAIGHIPALAERLGITLPVLHGWAATGIPPQYHDRVIAFAAERDIPITRASLEASYQPPANPREIVLALGGRNEVSRLTGASKNAVSNWYVSGIPPKFHNRMVRAANDLGIPGITLDLLEATHRPQPARPARAKPGRCPTCGRTVTVLAEAACAKSIPVQAAA